MFKIVKYKIGKNFKTYVKSALTFRIDAGDVDAQLSQVLEAFADALHLEILEIKNMYYNLFLMQYLTLN